MKAAAYARYSTDRQTDNSIAYQLEEISNYCKKENIEIIRTYTDEAKTGTNDDREGFKQLCGDAALEIFDTVVIYDIQRGSRDVSDWFIFRKAMSKLGIKVLSPNAQLGDILNPDDFLLELLNVGLGQREVLATRQKVIAGQTARAKEGVFLGGIAPLGYDIVDQKYIVNEKEARIVRMIFRMYAAGSSYGDIVDALKDERGKRGQRFGKNSLSSILRNDRYTGLYTWNRRKVKQMRKWAGGGPNPNIVQIEDRIPRIIDNDTWSKVQIRLSDRKQNAANKAKRREYLLSGIIECGECGAKYVGHTSRNIKGIETASYQCGEKYRTKSCKNKNLPAKFAEEAVINALKEYFNSMDLDKAVDEICKQVNLVTADLSKEKQELSDVSKKISNAMMVLAENPSFIEMKDTINQLQIKKSELEDIIYSHNRQDRGVDPEKLKSYLEQGRNDFDRSGITKDLIKQHITKVTTHPDQLIIEVGVHIIGSGGRI